ncbi:VOC family protein [Streptomyces sp. NPDC047002]|uniref:VOC family protein n=1 Tax=Streptomyces sp. NPDC047002 TaxID=3155475 RepID=UPI0034511448
MEILGTTLRIYVDDLDRAVVFYERLTGTPALRSERGGVSVAAVGCFLLMSGPAAEIDVLRKVTATIAVKDVADTAVTLTEGGGQVLVGPVETPGGRNLIALHPDGAVFEYVDRAPQQP